MLRGRVIPSLLLDGRRLVKTVRFRRPVYVGDPINAIRILNDKEVDEILVLDIGVGRSGGVPNYNLIEEIAGECFMPLAYGGGVRTVEQARKIIRLGAEKIVLNTCAWTHPDSLREMVAEFGSQAVVVAIDVVRRWFGRFEVFVDGGRTSTGEDPASYARRIEGLGAGEILLNSVEQEGGMKGFDVALIASVTRSVGIPVIASGGAGSLLDLRAAIREGGAAAVAAGAMFVFHGPHRAVLITYPTPDQVREVVSGQ